MQETKRLYWSDPYQVEFEAEVLDVIQTEFGTALVLDQTCFYAMSGGQVGDTGSLADERVRDTRYADDTKTVIYHYMEGECSLKKGDRVVGAIDWERRHKLMRIHSLVHVLGIVFEKNYGEQRCIGSSVNEKKGRIDYEFFDELDVEKLTKEVQSVVDRGLNINCGPSKEDASRRIWDMPGFGDMPCGGTHPENSSEIGKIKLKRKSLGKQGQRIYCSLIENAAA